MRVPDTLSFYVFCVIISVPRCVICLSSFLYPLQWDPFYIIQKLSVVVASFWIERSIASCVNVLLPWFPSHLFLVIDKACDWKLLFKHLIAHQKLLDFQSLCFMQISFDDKPVEDGDLPNLTGIASALNKAAHRSGRKRRRKCEYLNKYTDWLLRTGFILGSNNSWKKGQNAFIPAHNFLTFLHLYAQWFTQWLLEKTQCSLILFFGFDVNVHIHLTRYM